MRVKNYHGGVPTADMRLRNRDGSPVDPVPFLVLAAMAFAVAYSFGPIYFDALGVSYGRLYRLTGISPTGSTKSGTDYNRPYHSSRRSRS